MYQVALFVHIVGVGLLFAGDGITHAVMRSLQGASSTAQVRTLCRILHLAQPMHSVGPLLVLVAGLYMAITSRGFTTGWIDVALVGFLVAMALAIGVLEKRGRAIAEEAARAPEGPVSPKLRALIFDPGLVYTGNILFLWLAGYLYLMVLKPGFLGSLASMLVATVLGCLMAAASLKAAATRPASAPDAVAD